MGWGGGQGGCERRIEVFVKIQKKKKIWGGGGEGGGVGLGGQGACEQRIEGVSGRGRVWGGSGWM